MTAKIFIDGEAGTTGLQIKARLETREDLTLVHLDSAERKDREARRAAMVEADIAILCLPDAAARESAALAADLPVRLIDASTAHRVSPDWVYGFPEYDRAQREKIAAAKLVTNPGCYAISSVALLHPLVSAGLLPKDYPVTINAVSGYTGGGKSLVAEFEDPSADHYAPSAFWGYGLSLEHKHVPEIQARGGLSHRPIFSPSVGRYRQGMLVQIPLHLWSIAGAPSAADLARVYAEHYKGEAFIDIAPASTIQTMQRIDPQALNGGNCMRLHVFGHEENGQAIVMALIDNLGKGASGQAVQNLNIMLGQPEDLGLSNSVVFEA